MDNPYVGGKGYVNPEWKAKAESVAGGSRVSNTPTAVWVDRIAAINGTPGSSSNGAMGMRDHLDAALAQGATYAQFVIYNLPGRDCAALASNGELKADEIEKYKTAYINPIAAIQGDAKYKNLRIINVVEVDSLPNLVTNVGGAAGTPECATMKANGNYEKGIAYALKTLGAHRNVYNYVDAAHHGWLGWDTNFGPAAALFAKVAKDAGVDTVAGYIVNTANTSATLEPYFKVTDTVGGTTVRQSKWVDWNYYVDEQSFAQAFRQELVRNGLRSDIGMLIDTSRNGWGGPLRPSRPEHLDQRRHVRQPVPHRPPIQHRQLVQPGRCGPGRAAQGQPGHRYRRLRVGQASGRVRRLVHADPERRGQGLGPHVRPRLPGQRS